LIVYRLTAWASGPAAKPTPPGFQGRAAQLSRFVRYCFDLWATPGVRTSSPAWKPNRAGGPCSWWVNSIAGSWWPCGLGQVLRVAVSAPTQCESLIDCASAPSMRSASPNCRPLSGGCGPAGEAAVGRRRIVAPRSDPWPVPPSSARFAGKGLSQVAPISTAELVGRSCTGRSTDPGSGGELPWIHQSFRLIIFAPELFGRPVGWPVRLLWAKRTPGKARRKRFGGE